MTAVVQQCKDLEHEPQVLSNQLNTALTLPQCLYQGSRIIFKIVVHNLQNFGA